MTKSAWLVLLLCGAGLLCSGCISRASKASYPDSWSPVTAVPAGACPLLAGRYANAGELASGTKESSCGRHGPYRGEWCGEAALSQNIGNLASGDWVELRQPDKDTLVVVSSDPTVAVKELHYRKGDFSCTGKGLERNLHASAMGLNNNADETSVALDTFSAMATAFNAVTAGAGGVRTLTRRFSLAADGSLVMAVSQSEGGAILLIPYHLHEETFVRWTPVARPSGDAVPTPSADASVAPPADLPSAHVGLFEATNGSMWSKVKVTNLDGSPVNTYAGLLGVPIAMEPGRHWVQVGVQTTHLIPLRDVDTKYAFEIDAVAGHRYRIPKKPSACLAPGDIDAALASSSVYHARLSVIDEAPGSRGRSFDVEALCVSARSYVCVPLATATDAPADGLDCVRLKGWSRGYQGKDAGAVPAQ
jgi:hypothetical protein